jgi:membrane protease YdiL (CAAX protease family)
MRKAWIRAGLAFVNLILIAGFIAVTQGWLQKHLGSAGAAVLALLCLTLYVAISKLIERRDPRELAARRAVPELGMGLAGGLLLFSLVMAFLWIARAYHPQGIAGETNAFAKGFALALSSGIIEELFFRGLLFRMFSTLFGTWGALALTSALFGAAHLGNRGATITSGLAIAVEAGILLGAAYAATARLWLPIGLHIGWNFTEASVFGMSVSGNAMSPGLIRGFLSGPNLLTGGAFGPEASIFAVILCVAAALYLVRRIRKLRLAEPPMWRNSKSPAQDPQIAEPTAN